MRIILRNFAKFNGRKDYKRPWWFKLSNTMLEDPDLFDFTDAEIRAWIYLMSFASKVQNEEIDVNHEHAFRTSGVNRKALETAIEKLIARGVCTESVRNPNGICTESVLQTRLDKTRLDKNTNAHFEQCADEIYSLYPKKVGKKAGWVRLKSILKDEASSDQVKRAITNYKAKLARDKTEPKYIKQFDTFLSTWEDWLDPMTGTVTPVKLSKPKESYTPPPEVTEHDHTNKEEVLALLRGAIKTL